MKGKKILSLVLALAMVLGTMGTVAFAEETVVAKIEDAEYATVQAALEAAKDGDTIVITENAVGSEAGKEMEFSKAGTFTITGKAPAYELPIITFDNESGKTVLNIVDAELSMPEIDARRNATINVIDSTIYDAGGNSIVKSYYNGAINISGISVVYTMQVTTMGYITISDTATLNATWQTNVYGNGLITLEDDAKFATAALQLTGKDYSGRDNTDAERVGKPATIVVDGASMTVGKVYASNGADYSYHSSYGANIGTLAGKKAVLYIKNGADVSILMADGQTPAIGADGKVNISDSAFSVACREDGGNVKLENNGTINVYGESTVNITELTGETVDFCDGAIVKDSTIGGGVFVAGNVTFRGKNTFNMLSDFGTLTDYYGTTANMEWTVEKGASVTLTNKARYGLGYGDNVTIYGNIGDAMTARAGLTEDDVSLFMHGLVGQESSGWNCNSSFTANDAYVVIGSNNSFGNKPGNYGGTYTYSINNSVLDASRITFYEANSRTSFNITNSDVEMGTFMTRDADSVFTLTNSKVVSTATTNGTDEGNYNAGKLKLVNSDLTYSAEVTNTGNITVDINSTLTAPSITNVSSSARAVEKPITIDMTGYDGITALKLSDIINIPNVSTDDIGFINYNGEMTFDKASGEVILYSKTPVGGPVIGYTSEDAIWGETRANAKESYVIKIYSDETFLGQSSLNNVGGIIDGDLTPTWNIKLDAASNTDEYWTMSWDIAPSVEYMPTHVALVVDGVEVSRTEIQLNAADNLNKIHTAITDANGKILSWQKSLADAIDKADEGQTVVLLQDIVLDAPITIKKSVNIDGNGHKITQSAKCNNEHALLYFDATKVLDITVKNVTFDGIKRGAAIRTLGANMNIENCVFRNSEHTQVQGLVRLTQGSATIKNSEFLNNTCSMVVSFNYDTAGLEGDKLIVDNCVFEGNTANGTAVIYYVKGAGCNITNSEFIDNDVNCNTNGATIYLGFQENCAVKNCLFKDNDVVDSSGSKRVAGGIFFGYDAEITDNVFENNTAANANGDKLGQHICTSTYYDCEIDLNNNYFDGEEPAEGDHFFIQHQDGEGIFNLKNYYREYSVDADGNVVPFDLKPIISKVVSVQYVENTTESKADEGLKVYDIVIVAEDEQLINRLNTADLTFAIDSDIVDYVITPAEDITLSNIAGTSRYMFNFDGKDNVADTDRQITIGKVSFTGFDSFVFNIAEADTNLVSATTLDDNLVSYYDGTGLVINDEDENKDNDNYYGYIDTEIKVPTRTLTVNVTFPNAILDQAAAYQDMKVEINGIFDGVSKSRTYNLGKEGGISMLNGKYVVTDKDLVLDNAYTVTVSGAGYRTARYTVTMTTDKELTFWNNVMDNDTVVEKDVFSQKVNFLAGDIVKDSQINIYDLSAVVSYFGTVDCVKSHPEYAKYDLNRDGVIDSKDVAYVLVSWGK